MSRYYDLRKMREAKFAKPVTKTDKCPHCGHPHPWHKPCPTGVQNLSPVTKNHEPVTKTPESVTKTVTKRGRPSLGIKPMTPAEKMRRYRAQHNKKGT